MSPGSLKECLPANQLFGSKAAATLNQRLGMFQYI
ncbi:hypothetical protein ACVWXD_005089 [Pseudomonas sp. TE3911]|jgi:hypothetical protein|nr:hypothetical protein BW43_00443 [Pseudomonas sp. RIT357]